MSSFLVYTNMSTYLDRLAEPYQLKLQNIYDHYTVKYFNGNHVLAQVIPPMISVNVLYWIVSLTFLLLDMTGDRWTYLRRFHIRSAPRREALERILHPTWWYIVGNVLLNQVLQTAFTGFIAIVKLYLFGFHPQLPGLGKFILDWIVFVVLREITFYYYHRAVHHWPVLYRQIHKQHHRMHNPVAFGTVYGHPVDMIMQGVVPMLVGPMLVNAHGIVIGVWFHYVTLVSICDHGGYSLPFHIGASYSAKFHDFHHHHLAGNYGLNGLLDWLHGTDVAYKKSTFCAQNRMFETLFENSSSGNSDRQVDKKD